MDAALLARFAPPGLTWPEIVRLNGLGKRWWTEAVLAAEDNGHLLWRTKKGALGRWVLTDEGVHWIQRNAAGAA